MIRFLADHNFDRRVVAGLRQRRPGLVIITAREVGLVSAADPVLLEWAAQHRYVVLTHDRNTLIAFACERVRRGLPMPGVVVARSDSTMGRLVEDLMLLAEASAENEWENQVRYVPL